MTFRASALCVVACTLIFVTSINCAAQTVRFNYQAKLTNSSGGALQGAHMLHISLWDGGTSGVANSGTQVYSETASVSLNGGIVSHAVGTGDFSPGPALSETVFDTTNDLFLQVGVDSPANVVLPRERIEYVPTAVRALNGVPPGTKILSDSSIAPAGFTLIGSTPQASWMPRASLINTRLAHAVASANGNLFAIGGQTSVSPLDTSVEKYDPVKDTWTTVATLLVPRSELQCCEVGGIIYAFGGINPNNDTIYPNNEAYDPVANSWSVRQPLTFGRYVHASAVVNGKIYAITGLTVATSGFTSSTEEYNPGTNSWTNRAPIPTMRFDGAGASVGGKIYVLGGLLSDGNTFSTVNEMYDPISNTWSSKASVPVPTSSAKAVGFGGRIYLIGGYGSVTGSPFTTVRIYDPATDTWSLGSPMQTARLAFGAGLLNGLIYAAGGGGSAGPLKTTESLDPTTFFVLSRD